MNLQNRRFVLLGGSGFIGSYVADQLLARPVGEVVVFGSLGNAAANLAQAKQDARLKCVEGNVRDKAALRRVLADADGVFLLSSLWLKECAADPRAGFETNVAGGFNVLEACHEAGVKRLVYASSSAVYSGTAETPITESHPLDGGTFYGATKIAVERFLHAFHQMYDLSYAICRYTNVYGPRQQTKGDATSVIIRFLNRIAAHKPPVIIGTGKQHFDFIYVEDAARATVLAMEASFGAEAFNIASGVSVSINELALTLLKVAGSSLQPVYEPGVDASDYYFDTTKAAQMLGFQAQTALDDGLQALIGWYSAQNKLGVS